MGLWVGRGRVGTNGICAGIVVLEQWLARKNDPKTSFAELNYPFHNSIKNQDYMIA